MAGIPAIRPSPIAGTWYTGDPHTLAKSVDQYIAKAALPTITGIPVAVIAPHAGHLYSGATAGYAFRAIAGMTFDLVAVISPMHHYERQPLLTTAHQAYQTPLGAVAVDAQAVTDLHAGLLAELGFGLTAVALDREHSLEIELPFLQRALPGGFQLLPVMVRDQSPHTAEGLGRALARILKNRRALLVASTDLSHFYTEAEAQRLDQAMLDQVGAFSPRGVFQVENAGKGYACGLGALAAVLWAAQDLGATRVEILNHSTSAEITGDTAQVVGYGAAVALKPG